MDKIPMTLEGRTRLETELRQLKTIERPSIIRAIAEARDHGDLSENAEYHAARERQSFLEGRVAELEDKIVGAEEADIDQGRLSVTSPLARALIGKQTGDSVEVTTPRGSKAYEITKV